MHKMMFEMLISRFPSKLLVDLANTKQPPKHHPEGSVLVHTSMVFRKAVGYGADDDVLIAVLFHDLGKIDKTFEKDGRIVAYGHEHMCSKYIDAFAHLFPEARDWDKIRFICKHHMLMHRIDEMRPFKREALMSSPYWDDLVLFALCDNEGRG
jgi:predicted HD phosphohydrolase